MSGTYILQKNISTSLTSERLEVVTYSNFNKDTLPIVLKNSVVKWD